MPVGGLLSSTPSGTPTGTVPSALSFKVFDLSDMTTSLGTLTGWTGGSETTTDTVNDVGHGSLTLQNTDSQAALCTRGRVIQKVVDSTPAFSWIIDRTTRNSISTGLEAGQFTTFEGDGLAQLLNRAVVAPTRGYEQTPWAKSRTFSFASPEFIPTGWSNPTAIVSAQSNLSAYYDGKPASWINPQASWIAPSGTTDSAAWEGSFYVIGDHTFSSAGAIVGFAGADNKADLYGDGFGLTTFGTELGFDETHRVGPLYVSSGQFRSAAKISNYRDGAMSDPPPGKGDWLSGNPTSFIFSLYPIDSRGKLGALAIQTDTEWSILEYPSTPPGWTIGGVMNQLLTEVAAQIRLECPGFTWDFDATNDSHGNPWTTTYESITLNVGDDLLTVLRSFGGVYCDWSIAPDSPTLHLYRLGERGSVTTVSYSTSINNLTSLVHDTIDAGTDALLVSWDGGPQFLYPSSGGHRVAMFSAGNAKTKSEAQTMAAQQLALYGGKRVQFKAEIEPGGTSDQPYTGPKVADIVGIPDETDTASSQRVTQIVGTSDKVGNPQWRMSFSDVLLDAADRNALALKRMANGTLGGYSTTASPAGAVPTFGSKISSDEVSFSAPDPLATGLSTKDKTPTSSGNLYAVAVNLQTAGSTATTFQYLVDGVDVLGGAGSMAAGVTYALFHVNLGSSLFTAWIEGNKSKINVNITAVGTGAAGMVIAGQVLT